MHLYSSCQWHLADLRDLPRARATPDPIRMIGALSRGTLDPRSRDPRETPHNHEARPRRGVAALSVESSRVTTYTLLVRVGLFSPLSISSTRKFAVVRFESEYRPWASPWEQIDLAIAHGHARYYKVIPPGVRWLRSLVGSPVPVHHIRWGGPQLHNQRAAHTTCDLGDVVPLLRMK